MHQRIWLAGFWNDRHREKKWERKINASFATSVSIFQRLHRSNSMRIFIQKDIPSKRNWFAWHFFTFTTFVIQWKIDFRSTCCFRLKKNLFFFYSEKMERDKWKQHKVANRKLQMLHCIMQMLRLITTQKPKTFSYFPNATTAHTHTQIARIKISSRFFQKLIFFVRFVRFRFKTCSKNRIK